MTTHLSLTPLNRNENYYILTAYDTNNCIKSKEEHKASSSQDQEASGGKERNACQKGW